MQAMRSHQHDRIALPLQALFIFIAFPFGLSGAQTPQPSPADQPAQMQDPGVVAKGTIIPLELKNTLNSRTAYVGENIYCETIFPVTQNDRMLVPAHSWVKGHVTEIDQPGHIVGKAQLSIRLDSLTLPDGRTRPIECAIYSLAGARLGMNNDSGKNGKNGDTGNAQHVKNPPPTENIIDASGLGDAMSLMSATEGVGGLVLLLVSRGKRILLRPGTTMEIRLTAPVDFSPGSSSGSKPPSPHLEHRPAGSVSH